MKTTAVTVTRKHFTAANKADKLGKEARSKSCPIAQALMGMFPGADIAVRFTNAYVEKDGTTRKFHLSVKGQQLISDYDTHALKTKDLPIKFRMTEQTA